MLITDGRGSNLEITGDYLYRNYHLRQYEVVTGEQTLERRTRERTQMYSFAPKYTQKLEHNMELKAGLSYQYISYHDASASLTNDMNGQVVYGFLNLSGGSENLMYEVGTTLQYNRMDVTTNDMKTVNRKVYFCPQVSLMWVINSQHHTMLRLMYERNVEDMPYSVINSYRNYSDPSHYTTGNPSLKTPSDHQVILNLLLNRHLNFMLMYQRIEDIIYYTHGVDQDLPSVTWAKPANGKYEQLLVASAEWNSDVMKWWNMKLRAAAVQDKTSMPEKTVTGNCSGRFWWNNNFNFTPSLGGTLNGYWETRTTFENYLFHSVGHLEASLWKTFCNDRLRLSLKSNICGRERGSITYGNGYTLFARNTTHPTSFSFTVIWNFAGGKKVHQQEKAESIQDYKKIEERK